MDEDDNKKSRLKRSKRPADGRDPRFPTRFILLWVVILIMVPLFLKLRSYQVDNVEEKTYSQLRTLVDEGAIKKATVYRGGDTVESIKGDYEEAEANGTRKAGKFTTKVVWSDSIQ